MLIVLLRHGQTAYNEQRRYQGAADVPLSPAGRAALKKADFETETVYVTPLCRTAQTARILFPHARQIVVPALREMDFGVFEGRTYDEMKGDAAYCAWLDSGCESACPNGESKAVFCKRVCRAFEKLADEALARGDERLGHRRARRHADGGAEPLCRAASGLLQLECAACGRLCVERRRMARAAGAARDKDRWLCGGTDMNILYAMLGGFALDWLFGDPAWLTHPVVIMGKAISALERALRARLPKTPRGERLGGLTLAIVLPVGTLLLTGGVCRALGAVHPLLGFAVELLWCAQALAATGSPRRARTSTASWKRTTCPRRERRSAALSAGTRRS